MESWHTAESAAIGRALIVPLVLGFTAGPLYCFYLQMQANAAGAGGSGEL